MDRRAWTGVAAGTLGTAAAVAAAVHGQALAGGVAALACGVTTAAAVVNAQRAGQALDRAEGAELVRQAAEARVGTLITEAARPHPAESVYDAETGLLDHRVFAVTFDTKVAAARRHLRPLSLILIDLAGGPPTDPVSRTEAFSRWGRLVAETLRDSDIACRVGDATFAIICEDTSEGGAVWVAERLQIATVANSRGLMTPFRAAAATYPNHGLSADELLRRAWDALERARQNGADPRDRLGRVELPSVD